MPSRRQFLSGLATAVAVAGFDPIARTWIPVANAGDCTFPAGESVPELDGTLHTDLATRESDATDQGNLIHLLPAAVLRPGSVADIQKMIHFCRRHNIKVAARGQHHTTYGQGLTCGLIIEMSSLNTIHSIGPAGADVDAGSTWKSIVLKAWEQGLKPRGLTGYTALSIGGTLSVGGCPMTNREGALVDHVRALTVVTGRGDVVRCSESEHRELFEAALGGLGQCGIIVRATVDLVPALPMARTYFLHYGEHDSATFFRDKRTLLTRGELQEVYTVCMPPGSSTFVYQINATVFYDPASPPDDAHLLRGLSLPPQAAVRREQSYPEYALFVDGQIDLLRQAIGWDSLIKPWFDVWLPDSAVEGYAVEQLSRLTQRDVGSAGFLLLFAQQRSKMRRPFFRLPTNTGEADWVWLFDILTNSTIGVPDPSFTSDMLARNRRLFDAARSLGATRYPIGALNFTREDWVKHYGELWTELVQRKQRFDPNNILTPGPGIF